MKLITDEQLREQLQVTRQGIYKWRKQGMPHIKLGRSIRYDLEEVIEWLNKRGA